MGLLEIGSSDKGISLGDLYTGTSLEVSAAGVSWGLISGGKVSSVRGSYLGLICGLGLGFCSGLRCDNGRRSFRLIIGVSGCGRCRIQTPLGQQGLGHLLGLGELEEACLLGHNGALVLGAQLGHQLGDELADLLGVQVAHLLGHINKGSENLVVAFLLSLLEGTAGAADLNGQLLTGSVADKLAGLLLNILGGTGGLVHGSALLGALAVAHLGHGLVALLHGLVERLLLEGDLTSLLKVLLTNLFLNTKDIVK